MVDCVPLVQVDDIVKSTAGKVGGGVGGVVGGGVGGVVGGGVGGVVGGVVGDGVGQAAHASTETASRFAGAPEH